MKDHIHLDECVVFNIYAADFPLFLRGVFTNIVLQESKKVIIYGGLVYPLKAFSLFSEP